MAFLAPLAGGGLFANLGFAALAAGANLALAYFWPQKVQGPRAESTKAQTSKYGDPLARVYGSVRIAGAVIWLKNDRIDEHKRTYRAGKALGPEVTEYSYTATFAVAFAWNGPAAAITRIWADDKVIFDMRGAALDAEIAGTGVTGIADGATIQIYLGEDDQPPDADIQADKGVTATSAWPGLVYVKIKDLPLDEIGIRLPNIEAEIVQSGALSYTSDALSGDLQTGDLQLDINAGLVCNTSTAGGVRVWQMPGGELTLSNSVTAEGTHIDDQGILWVPRGVTAGTIKIYDGRTGIEYSALTATTGFTVNIPMTSVNIDGQTHAFVWRDANLHLFKGSLGSYALQWTYATGFSAGTYAIVGVVCSPTRVYGLKSSSKGVEMLTWSATGVSAQSTVNLTDLASNLAALHYDAESDSVIAVDMGGGIYVYTPDLSTLLRSVDDDDFVLGDKSHLMSNRLKSGPDKIAFRADVSLVNHVFEYRVSDLVQINDWNATDNWTRWAEDMRFCGAGSDYRIVVVVGNSASEAPTAWFLPRTDGTKITDGDIIEAECALVGITADASAITSQSWGYPVRAAAAPRGVIDDITRVRFVDWAMVDGSLLFFYRSNTVDRALAIGDLQVRPGDEPDGGFYVDETWPDLRDLPQGVVVKYFSKSADYRTGAQEVATPDGLDDSAEGILEVATSLIFGDDDEAAQAADIIFNETREASRKFATALGPKALDLHPGDVVTLPLDAARSVTAVLESQQGDFVIDAEFRGRDFDYSSAMVGVVPNLVSRSLVRRPVSIFVPIDAHLLRADDDDDGFYSVVGLRSAGDFTSATVYRSTDAGATFEPWDFFEDAAALAWATQVLADRPQGSAAWDRATSLTVNVINGTMPASVTDDALLADGSLNVFAVAAGTEWEYIRAATVTDNGDGTFELADLLRGQNGTEFAMDDHAKGDQVVYLTSTFVHRGPNADRSLSRDYVAVTAGLTFDDLYQASFTNAGRGLRPWSPVQVAGSWSAGDLTVTWIRRDRVPQPWADDGDESLTMSEASENYTVKVYNAGWSTVLREIDVTAETATYTAAQQVTDFGSPVPGEGATNIAVVQVGSIGDGIEERQTL